MTSLDDIREIERDLYTFVEDHTYSPEEAQHYYGQLATLLAFTRMSLVGN